MMRKVKFEAFAKCKGSTNSSSAVPPLTTALKSKQSEVVHWECVQGEKEVEGSHGHETPETSVSAHSRPLEQASESMTSLRLRDLISWLPTCYHSPLPSYEPIFPNTPLCCPIVFEQTFTSHGAFYTHLTLLLLQVLVRSHFP